MPDREKVIRLIEEEISVCESVDQCYRTIDLPALRDILALLKEQRETTTFKPHYIDKYGKNFICGVECGTCHKEISSIYHYCPYCGREVKWDDSF